MAQIMAQANLWDAFSAGLLASKRPSHFGPRRTDVTPREPRGARQLRSTQTAVCNRHQSLDQQLCRWLLLSLNRLDGNELVMTQELIANMLGVRREGGH